MRNLGRWSLALAVATGAVIPLPVLLMRVVWAGVLLLGEGVQRVTRWPAMGRLFPGPIQDPRLFPTSAQRLFLYSTTDEMVGWQDVEDSVARWRRAGCSCTTEMFDKSPHVGHMRIDPERYWNAIAEAWEDAAM